MQLPYLLYLHSKNTCFFALLLKIDIGDEDDDDDSEGSDTECNETLNISQITEMRLVPSDPNQGDVDLCSLYVLL